ncbi:MAG: tubulin-like doman-containing protein [bacterium]|nr:tubulin-like doman-containing protein [bacterium]
MTISRSLSPSPRINIGLGGLGSFIVMLSHQVLQEAGAKHFRTILIDTDSPKTEQGASDDDAFSIEIDLDALDDQLTIVRLTGSDLSVWQDEHSAVLDGMFIMPLPANVASGAAKQRIIGSAAGHEKGFEIRSALETAMDQVRLVEDCDHAVLSINLVCGASGGTGSANILRAAMLAHDAFHANFDASLVRLEIRVVLVLPDCYNVAASLRAQVERNAVFTLREIMQAQREGMTMTFPEGGDRMDVSVPPGFLHKITTISSRSAKGNISLEQVLDQLGTYLVLDANPVIGKAIADEEVDVLGNIVMDDPLRCVTGVGAYRFQLADTSQLEADVMRHRTAHAFLGLPAIPNYMVTGLTDQLLPITMEEFAGGASLPTVQTVQMIEVWIQDNAGDFNLASMSSGLSSWSAGLQLAETDSSGRPNVSVDDIRNLAEQILPIGFDQVTVTRPRLSLDPDDVRSSGTSVVTRVLSELEHNMDSYRDGLITFFGGQRSAPQSAIQRFVQDHGKRNLQPFSVELSQEILRLEQIVNPVLDIVGDLSDVALRMETAVKHEDRKPTMWERIKGKAELDISSQEHASDLIGRVMAHYKARCEFILAEQWNAFLGGLARDASRLASQIIGEKLDRERHLAEQWNGFVRTTQRDVRNVASTLTTAHRIIEQTAHMNISAPPPVVEGTGFRKVLGADLDTIMANLPDIDTKALAQGGDVLTNINGVLSGGNATMDRATLLCRNPVVLNELERVLRSDPFLSFNGSRCNGRTVTRIFMSGPPALLQHPVLREQLAKKQLRYETNGHDDEINIVIVVYGVKAGAISGVSTWETRLVGADNSRAVALLPFVHLPTLVEVQESKVMGPFLTALICGSDLPEDPMESDPWSHQAPDAMIRRTGEQFIMHPYPGAGRKLVPIGETVRHAWENMKLDVQGSRRMANQRFNDLSQMRSVGLESMVLQVGEFATAVEQQLSALDLAISETQGSKSRSAKTARNLAEQEAQAEDLRWLFRLATRWVEDQRRQIEAKRGR